MVYGNTEENGVDILHVDVDHQTRESTIRFVLHKTYPDAKSDVWVLLLARFRISVFIYRRNNQIR